MVLLLSSERVFVLKVFGVLAHIQKWSCHVPVLRGSLCGSELAQTMVWCGSEKGFSGMLESRQRFLESHDEDLNGDEKPG